MLEVKDVSIAAGEKILVKNLSFMARDGQLTCITGRSGVGKTTLLRTLMGFMPTKEGFVSVDGELLTVRSAHVYRRMMTYLPQECKMLTRQLIVPEAPSCEEDEYGVWNNLLPSLAPESQPEPLSSEDVVRLTELTLQNAGDKQMFIVDEFADHLLPEHTEHVLDLLRSLARVGKTVLVVSCQSQIVGCADQVINLDMMGR